MEMKYSLKYKCLVNLSFTNLPHIPQILAPPLVLDPMDLYFLNLSFIIKKNFGKL